ncbi:sensor histidine kinase [Sphingobacterium sp. LRF_L2]|uniref:sensor histidine kinase n=1 Tax=Sphingobacterium sp. LRF_L2 TaxID=3369421 RepID=UPI003F5FB326
MELFKRTKGILIHLWQKIECIGVDNDMPYLLNRRVRMVNMISLFCFVIPFLYGIANIQGDHYLLTIVDWTFSIASLFVFRLNYIRQHKLAQVYLLVSTSIFLICVNFLSFNIAEYYLLCVLIVSLLVFHHIWIQTIVTTILVTAILVPKFFSSYLPMAHVLNKDRLLVNVPLALFFILIVLRHFKQIQKNYQEEIKQQHLRLSTLNKDKEQLFAIIAHDVRSPLATATNMLKMLINNELPAAQQTEKLNLVQKQLVSLTDNVDNLLYWSSQNLKGLISRPVHLHLHELLFELLQSMVLQAEVKNIRFQLDIPAKLRLFADPEQVRIILRNILNNAIKFSHEGGEISICAQNQGTAAKISISDKGVGIPRAKLKALFNNLQDPSYGTFGERGSGLGLVLIHNLLEANRGKIQVKSAVNVGTTFTIELPLRKTEIEAAHALLT